MTIKTNECVGCFPELGCIDNNCPYRNIQRYYCDECGDECDNIHKINGQDICEDCLKEIVENAWSELTTKEKAHILDIL